MDGLIIQDGNANGDIDTNTNPNAQWHWKRGGGLFIESQMEADFTQGIIEGMTFINCIVRNNEAEHGGGGMFVHAAFGRIANQQFLNCTFDNNKSTNSWAGAVLNDAYNGINVCLYEDCVFTNNFAQFQGGAMTFDGRNEGSCTPIISRSTFENNSCLLYTSDAADE